VKRLTNTSYDVLVIGGGIHGAGVAQAAAARGYSVLVLEQNQIAAGTSSRSSKLIHGGLRYLETGQLALVKECLFAREMLLKNAPELVKRQAFYIPIYKNSKRSILKVWLGLTLYGWLGGYNKNKRFKRIPRQQWDKLDGLDTDNLKAVYQYWDAQTDDKALTTAVMNSAIDLGAKLCMPAIFLFAFRKDDHYAVEYLHQGKTIHCKAKTVINAAGPWVNEVLGRTQPVIPQIQTQLIQGTHIILDGCITQGVYYAEAPSDKRPVFVMPWQDKTLVGTTETIHTGHPSDTKPTVAERTYLLEALSYYFPKYRSSQTARINAAFSGLRVLPQTHGNFNKRARDTLLDVDDKKDPRFLTIYGGKLTAYRITAENALDHLQKNLPISSEKSDLRTLKLKPGPLKPH